MPKGLDALVKRARKQRQEENLPENLKFIKMLDKYFKSPPEDLGKKPYVSSKAFKPSSIHKCPREIYYSLKYNSTRKEAARGKRILEVGTALHEWIQECIMEMYELEQFDIKPLEIESIEGRPIITAHSASPMEVKFKDHRYSSQFPISGMVDGAMEIRGERYIFEFKTINTDGFKELYSPKPEHQKQGALYALSLEIPKVMFLYLDKNTQDLKAFVVEYTEAHLDWVKERIGYIEDCHHKKELPIKEEEALSCRWCGYKNLCKENQI